MYRLTTPALVSVGLGTVTAIVVVATASGARRSVGQATAIALVLLIGSIVARSMPLAAAATVPMLGAALVETGVSGDQRVLRSLLVGCLWYLTLEVAWDGIERVDGDIRTPAATARRVQEWCTVVALSVTVGVAALVSAPLIPRRTLPLQMLLVGGSLAALVWAVRSLVGPGARPSDPDRSDIGGDVLP